MLVEIDTSKTTDINWNAKGINRIVQNIMNLLNTFTYEVAYERTIGLTGKFIDKPLDQAIAEVTTEIFDLISEREPRAEVKEVQYLGIGEDGMNFKVVVDIE